MEDSWLNRQLQEISNLEAIYFEDDELRVDREALEQLRSFSQQQQEQDSPQAPDLTSEASLPSLSLSTRLRLETALAGQLRLAVVLPSGYPSGSEATVPIVWLEPDGDGEVGRLAEDEELRASLEEAVSELAATGEECLLPLLQQAEELIGNFLKSHEGDWLPSRLEEEEEEAFGDDADAIAMQMWQEDLAESASQGSWNQRQAGPPKLGRRSMYSHHIIASGKREVIKKWADELKLGVLVKIGWPGLIIAEGDERHVQAYIDALSRLRWKHFVVRGEQTDEGASGQALDELRALPACCQEFGTEGLADFAAASRHYGLEELFLAALKMTSSGASQPKRGPTSKSQASSKGKAKTKR